MQLDDDPKTDEDVLLVLVLKQLECEWEDVLGVGLEQVIGRQPLDHLQHQLSHLISISDYKVKQKSKF